MPQTEQRRDLVTRSYQVRAETINEKERSVEAVLATETQVDVFDWNRWEIITEVLLMSGCRLPANGQMPLQDSHDRSTVQKQLGSCRNLRIENDKLVGRNYFSSSPVSEHPWTLIREGHLTDNSIGYRVINPVLIEAGKSLEVGGKVFTAPANRNLRIAVEWEPKENSVCSIGADAGAKNRNDSVFRTSGDKKMEKFKEWLKARGLEFDELNDSQRSALQKDYDAEVARAQAEADAKKKAQQPSDGGGHRTEPQPQPVKPAKEPEDPKRIAAEAVEAERQRVAAIRALAGEDVKPEIIDRAITEGKTIDQARALVLEAVRTGRPKVAAPTSFGGAGEMNARLIGDAMLLRAGYDDIILEDKTEGAKRAEQANKLRDMSLLDVFRYAIMLEGGSVPISREDVIRTAFSTVSLPVILGAVANKSLMRGYNDIPQSWRRWCNIGSANNFLTQTRARMTTMGGFTTVGSGGEIKHGAIEEESEQLKLQTEAMTINLTRQMIINDDLGALTRIPRQMGVLANQRIAEIVYEHFMGNPTMGDSVALFYASHSNLNTSATLAAPTLRAAVTAFAKQTNKNGKPIGITPKFLLVPPDLRHLALELAKSVQLIIAGTAGSVTERGALNAISEDALEVISEARLSNSAFTNYSTTTWYMTADPRQADTVEVSFLNGVQTPTFETFRPLPGVLGMITQCYFDATAKALDWRGVQKNTA